MVWGGAAGAWWGGRSGWEAWAKSRPSCGVGKGGEVMRGAGWDGSRGGRRRGVRGARRGGRWWRSWAAWWEVGDERKIAEGIGR